MHGWDVVINTYNDVHVFDKVYYLTSFKSQALHHFNSYYCMVCMCAYVVDMEHKDNLPHFKETLASMSGYLDETSAENPFLLVPRDLLKNFLGHLDVFLSGVIISDLQSPIVNLPNLISPVSSPLRPEPVADATAAADQQQEEHPVLVPAPSNCEVNEVFFETHASLQEPQGKKRKRQDDIIGKFLLYIFYLSLKMLFFLLRYPY